MMITTIQ